MGKTTKSNEKNTSKKKAINAKQIIGDKNKVIVGMVAILIITVLILGGHVIHDQANRLHHAAKDSAIAATQIDINTIVELNEKIETMPFLASKESFNDITNQDLLTFGITKLYQENRFSFDNNGNINFPDYQNDRRLNHIPAMDVRNMINNYFGNVSIINQDPGPSFGPAQHLIFNSRLNAFVLDQNLDNDVDIDTKWGYAASKIVNARNIDDQYILERRTIVSATTGDLVEFLFSATSSVRFASTHHTDTCENEGPECYARLANDWIENNLDDAYVFRYIFERNNDNNLLLVGFEVIKN